jgi:hypothetical protein
MMLSTFTTIDTYIGYLALSALRSEADNDSEMACRKANPPTIFMYGRPSAIKSGLNPIHNSRSSAIKISTALITSPNKVLNSSEIPTT